VNNWQLTITMSALNIEKLFGVKGYIAVVTGGSSGLGFMISKVWNSSPVWASYARCALQC